MKSFPDAADAFAYALAAPTSPRIWIQTLPALGSRQGGRLDLINPDPAQIDFRTVATVLARVPRFSGQTGMGSLPVAQHCAEGARAVLRDTGRSDWAAAFLLHDAHEYAIGDIATPVAKAIGAHVAIVSDRLQGALTPEQIQGVLDIVLAGIASLKTTLDEVIFQAAGLPYPLDPQTQSVVKLYDRRMLMTERLARMASPPTPWTETAEPILDLDLYPWTERHAAAMWYGMAQELLPAAASWR